jgi:hypothetical protein
MISLDDNMVDKAARFLWTSGRVLEQRRFAYLFGGESDRGGVLTALDAYRSPDGGYAFGLEPDVRGPAGQPIAVPAALRVLRETASLPGPEATRICDWLTAHTAPDGGVPAVLASLRPYPRPPWLPIPDRLAGDLLATGQIAGPLLAAGVEHPWLAAAGDFCRLAIEGLERTHPYEAEAAVAFLDGVPDRSWAARQARRLGELVREQRIVLLDPAHPEGARLAPGYAAGEYHLPHDYAPRPDSLARAWFTRTELERGLRHLAAGQQEDGGWPIHWAEWAPTTRVEARPGVTLAALLTLRAYDRDANGDPDGDPDGDASRR